MLVLYANTMVYVVIKNYKKPRRGDILKEIKFRI